MSEQDYRQAVATLVALPAQTQRQESEVTAQFDGYVHAAREGLAGLQQRVAAARETVSTVVTRSGEDITRMGGNIPTDAAPAEAPVIANPIAGVTELEELAAAVGQLGRDQAEAVATHVKLSAELGRIDQARASRERELARQRSAMSDAQRARDTASSQLAAAEASQARLKREAAAAERAAEAARLAAQAAAARAKRMVLIRNIAILVGVLIALAVVIFMLG